MPVVDLRPLACMCPHVIHICIHICSHINMHKHTEYAKWKFPCEAKHHAWRIHTMNIKSKYPQNDTHSLLKIFRKTSKAMKNSSKFHLSEQTWLALLFRHQIVGGCDNPWGSWQAGEKVILYKQLSSYKNFRSNRAPTTNWGDSQMSAVHTPKLRRSFLLCCSCWKRACNRGLQRNYCANGICFERPVFTWLCTRAFQSGSYRTSPGLPDSYHLTQRRKHGSFNLKILNVLNVKIKRRGVIAVKWEDSYNEQNHFITDAGFCFL